MNLRQAYDGWSQQEQNRQLYVKTREAFRKAWFTLPTNMPCSWYTKDVLALALAETRVVESDKVKAASVMIHVLTWANFAEPEYNPAPDFKMEDVTRLMRLPADELEKERERITAAMQCLPERDAQPANHGDCPTDSSEAKIEGTVPCDSHRPDKGETMEQREPNDTGINLAESRQSSTKSQTSDDADPLAGIDFNDTNDKPNEQTNMSNEKKPRGKQPKPVAQLDPTTLQVVKVWPSRCEAERETGACNIDRCIAHHRMSAGYYWCQPDEVDGFKPNPLSGNQPKVHKKKVDAATVNNALAENMRNLERMKNSKDLSAWTPKFKKNDHVWSKTTKELAGRTGYVMAVDTYKMEYTVAFGKEAWIIPENDLELVNEPVMAEYITKRSTEGLADYTDDELLEELDRRGWEGELSRRQVVTIGVREQANDI